MSNTDTRLDELAERASDSIPLPHHEEDRADLYVAIRAALREALALGREEQRAKDAEVCRARAASWDTLEDDTYVGDMAFDLSREASACAKAIEKGEMPAKQAVS